MKSRVELIPMEVLVSTYDAEAELRLVLEAFLGQTEPDFSVAVVDDGSGPGVGRLVKEFADRGLRLRHVWQEDRGFRKARALNRAVASSSAEYLVLIDGDCIPSRHFVRDHMEWAEPGRFACGRRVLLGPVISNAIRDRRTSVLGLENPLRLLAAEIRGQLRRAWVGVRSPRVVSRLLSRKRRGMWGCNAGIWMTDLVRVNGFNNAFEGWGCEDVDLERRLLAADVRPKALRGMGAVFHLYHQSHSSEQNERLRTMESERSSVEVESGLRECNADN
jgi:glycosyltransferase involved in cell wall biosynthesis